MVMRKHIRTEIPASDGEIGNLLDERPPVGVEQHGLFQPVADNLLARSRPAGLPQPSGKSRGVSSGERDGAPQSGNVSFLHAHAKYTNRFVYATNRVVGQPHKEVCTVLGMTAVRNRTPVRRPIKPPKPRRQKRVALPGPDGKRLGDRVREAMAYKTGRIGEQYRPADLLRDINRLAPSGEIILSQQMLSAILRNIVNQTSKTPAIAQACGVSATWMAHGIGKMID